MGAVGSNRRPWPRDRGHDDEVMQSEREGLREAAEDHRAMSGPLRIQQQRRKGWRRPPNSRSVARPGRLGNSVVRVEEAGSNAAAVERLREWALAPEQAEYRAMVRRELRGKNLACWCRTGLSCHADVLLEIAHEEEQT